MKFFCRELKVKSRAPARFTQETFCPQPSTLNPQRFQRRAFTLVEIMVVVAIIGLVAAMGLPSIIMALQKDGMRKAVSDVRDVCSEARAKAIFNKQTMSVIFHPQENRLEVEGAAAGNGSGSSANASSGKVTSAVLPDGIAFAMVDINLQDYLESSVARVRFFPNGTSDEMTLILLGRGQKQMITLEFSTGLTSQSDVTK
jgi:prepilin-type N-terminal cleavage/methylation domain-containing protein